MTRILQPIQTTWLDYPDNESLAIIVCMMGCEHKCPDCHNLLFQNFNYDIGTKEYNINEFINEIKNLSIRNRTNKIVLSGGDVLHPKNIEFTKEFLNRMKDDYQICIYTGYNIEYVKNNNVKGYTFIKCGLFNKNLYVKSDKTDDYIQFASTNQKLYDKDNILLSKNGRYYF